MIHLLIRLLCLLSGGHRRYWREPCWEVCGKCGESRFALNAEAQSVRLEEYRPDVRYWEVEA